MKIAAVVSLAAALVGCAASSHITVGTVRPKIDPAAVRLYLTPPAKFEEVAVLEASSKNSITFGSQAKADKVVERLKNEAAALGANGVLLGDVGEQQSGSVSTGSATTYKGGAYGSGVTAGIFDHHGKAVAIFVAPGADDTVAHQ